MATTRAQSAVENSAPAADVASAAVADAVEGASDTEKEALALALYKEATGRFPQVSSDRKAVYFGGFVLVGVVFLATVAAALLLGLDDKSVPEWLSTLATALGSGVIGGLFGYARQD